MSQWPISQWMGGLALGLCLMTAPARAQERDWPRTDEPAEATDEVSEEPARLPRWYCLARSEKDPHYGHSAMHPGLLPSYRNALLNCAYSHQDESPRCRVSCWRL